MKKGWKYVKIKFCGAAGTVTGSCFLITTEETKFLVDCGMFQGSKALKELNYGPFIFEPQEIDFVLLTHAHVDHCGLLPKLYKHGFRGKTYCTKATKELCAVVLPDSGHIQEMEVERKNRKNARKGQPLIEPIYTVSDAEKSLNYIEGICYRQAFQITSNIRVCFQDAGHILGSAIIEVYITEEGKEHKLVFSGDIGNVNQPIIEDPTEIESADLVVMESTYGNRFHLETEDKLKVLASVVRKTHKKGGNLVIPSFAVERTQDLIYHLKKLKDTDQIPAMDIYIDSPMAVEATKVFINNPQNFDEEASCLIKGTGAKDFFQSPDIHYVLSAEESIALNKIKSGAIIISASGMADAGRIKHHLKHNLWRPESTVLFVGYQAQGTLGRRILEGEKKVRIHGEEIAVNADIAVIDGFSAHADQAGLLKWISGFKNKPEHVFLVHGEEGALNTLQRLMEAETGLNVDIAEYATEYDVLKGVEVPVAEGTFAPPVLLDSELADAFQTIKQHIEMLAQLPRKDRKMCQSMLTQLNEIEKKLNKAG